MRSLSPPSLCRQSTPPDAPARPPGRWTAFWNYLSLGLDVLVGPCLGSAGAHVVRKVVVHSNLVRPFPSPVYPSALVPRSAQGTE